MKRSILFICTANICRSPMAMGLFRELVSQSGDEWRIESAGVWADPGFPAARNTQKVLEARGLEVNDHRSRPVSAEMIDEFDLILVMERNHQEALRAAFPDKADHIYLLSELIDERSDIVDPVGGSLADYEDTALELEKIFEQGFDKILRLTGEG